MIPVRRMSCVEGLHTSTPTWRPPHSAPSEWCEESFPGWVQLSSPGKPTCLARPWQHQTRSLEDPPRAVPQPFFQQLQPLPRQLLLLIPVVAKGELLFCLRSFSHRYNTTSNCNKHTHTHTHTHTHMRAGRVAFHSCCIVVIVLDSYVFSSTQISTTAWNKNIPNCLHLAQC